MPKGEVKHLPAPPSHAVLPPEYPSPQLLVVRHVGLERARRRGSRCEGIPCHRFKLTNNIFGFGRYGVGIDGGQNTFAEAFPGGIVAKNLLVGHGEGRAEHLLKNKTLADGFLVEPKHVGTTPEDDADWSAVGFANFVGGDYRLTAASKYRTAGTDGKPLGADIDAIEAAREESR